MSNLLPEVIEFPDIEALLRAHLAPRVGVPVSTGVPKPRPASFLVVRRTGGPTIGVGLFDQPMVTVEAWATSTVTAMALATTARAHLRACPGRIPEITSYLEFSGPASLPDPESGQARYTWTCSLTVRGHAVT